MHTYWLREANPYFTIQVIVTALLVLGAYGWKRVRPTPSRLVRGYIVAASTVTTCGMFLATCGDLRTPDDVCGGVLKASMVLTVFVYLEVGRAVRAKQIAKATARYRREERIRAR